MAVSDRSNPSLARFWGFVLAVMFYGFVMAGLLGIPAHKTGISLLGPAGTRPAQVAGVPRPESEATASAPVVTPTERTAKAQPETGSLPLAASAPPPPASTTHVSTIAVEATSLPTANGPVRPQPGSEASTSAPMVTPPENAANAQPDSGATPLAAGAPPSPQADKIQVPAIASAPKPAAGGLQPEGEASASAPLVTPTQNAANAQPNPSAMPLAAAAPPSPQTNTTQLPTIASAAKPVSGGRQPESNESASAPMVTPTEDAPNAPPNSAATPIAAAALPAPEAVATQLQTIVITAKPVPRPALVNIRHRCADSGWTWQSGACPARPRPVVWRWVLRGCAIRLGNLCIGPSYAPIQVAGTSERHVWR